MNTKELSISSLDEIQRDTMRGISADDRLVGDTYEP